jgi:1-pyrroline-5-carboxylate dehydrogenase
MLEALHEAGMPPGVVQFVPGVAEECGRVLTQSPDLAALHFTGSTSTFNHLWRSISSNISKYSYIICHFNICLSCWLTSIY